MSDDRTSEFHSLVQSLPGGSGMGMGWSGDDDRYEPVPSLGGDGLMRTTATTSTSLSSSSSSFTTTKAPPHNANHELRVFHKTAGEIAREIAATSELLGELTQLVQQKSIFTDDSNRINSLVLRIKSNVENLNGKLEDAGTIIAQHKRKMGSKNQAGQQANNVVSQLKEEFVEATAGFKKVLQQRTDIMKETSTMKLNVYGTNQDVTDPGIGGGSADDNNATLSTVSLENKPPVYNFNTASGMGAAGVAGSSDLYASHGALSGGANMQAFPTIDLTSAMAAGESTSSSVPHLPRPHGATGLDSSSGGLRLRTGSGSGGSMHHHDPNRPTYSGSYSSLHHHPSSPSGGGTPAPPLTPLDIQRMEQESGQDQMMQLIPDQNYLRERENAMTEVEANIVELGTIFNKLAVMVSEHREMVERVEDNVEEANMNINLSMNALTDTLTNLQTNRALFFKVFGVLVAFIILFVVFLA